MRLRKRPAPVLLLLIPALPVFASSLPGDVEAKQVGRAAPVQEYPAIATLPSVSPTLKPDVGTKDAPVDGLDGKPHKGPFVEGKLGKPKKPVAEVEEIVPVASKLPESSSKKLTKEVLENDGVMDDPDRVVPQKGTTGTEGGVSAKDRDRKKEEDRTGEKAEKIPDPPKEAPPLPHGEQELIKDKTPTESSARKLGAVGLEVCCLLISSHNITWLTRLYS